MIKLFFGHYACKSIKVKREKAAGTPREVFVL